MAQSNNDVPSAAEITRIEDQIRPAFEEQTLDERLTIPQISMQQAPEGAETVFFMLSDLVIEGNTALSDQDLAPYYQDYVGQEIALSDLYIIAREITRAYRDAGFILSQALIPAQEIVEGRATIRVIEGFIDGLNVEGSEDSLMVDRIKVMAHELRKERPLSAETLEKQLLLLNDLGGVNARTVISPSQDLIGAADVTIIIDQKPYEANLSVDNFGSRFLGALQYGAAAKVNNVFNAGESITFQTVQALANNELEYYGLGYDVPINNYGTRLRLNASYAETDPGYTLERLNVRGFSKSLGLSVSHPWHRSRNSNFSTILGFDYAKSASKSDVDITRIDRTSVLNLGMQYDALDTFWNVGVTQMSLNLYQGLDILGSSAAGDASLSRANGEPEFNKAVLQMSRTQRISPKFTGFLGFKGQYASDSLLSGQEIGLGGSSFGRGYDPSEVSGDHGMVGTVELRWADPFKAEAAGISVPYSVFAFYDLGRVWNENENASLLKKDSIASTGIGLTMQITDTVNATGYLAVPLTRDVGARGKSNRRAFFSLSKSF